MYVILVLVAVVSACHGYTWDTYYYTQQVDHFSFQNTDTFQQRFLVNHDYWNPDGGPIFVYTGNEGYIDWFANATGFMWDIAPEFKAMLVFVEHRFYGKSKPYGEDSFSDIKYLGYLSVEQTLADYAAVIRHIKATVPGADGSAVISFGGSYGGILAAWFRMKYPHITDGAVAASAPLFQFPGVTSCGVYNNMTTQAFYDANPECSATIRKSWAAITEMANQPQGKKNLTSIFRLCKPVKTDADVQDVKHWLYETWGNVAMINYPYPANFITPLPAWPVKAMCQPMNDSSRVGLDLLESVYQATNIFYNYTGTTQCMDTANEGTEALGVVGWSFQTCAEMVMPMCSDGVNDMYEPAPWDIKAFARDCLKKWNVVTRPDHVTTMFGGRNISQFSNILFSNGDIDPWSGGGVMKSVSDSLIAVVIPGQAHHLDLRAASPEDPPEVVAARNMEKAYLRKWIHKARRMYKINVKNSYRPDVTE